MPMWFPIKQPYQVMDGLLVEVFIVGNGQDWAAWVVWKSDGYYCKSFLRADSLLHGPFETIHAAKFVAHILQ